MRPTRQGELLPRMAVILANRDDLPLAEVVRRHRAKQGHENAFKGPLVDMDLHHPPCRGYRANQAFYAYGQMAHLLLRTVQYRLLPKAARRHGIRPLVRHVMRTVARLVRSGRRLSLLFASCTAPFGCRIVPSRGRTGPQRSFRALSGNLGSWRRGVWRPRLCYSAFNGHRISARAARRHRT